MSVIGSNVLAGASGQSAGGGGAGYEIERSLRFNSADSAYLNRTPSAAGNRKTWTWSGWVKRGKLDTTQHIFEGYTPTDILTFLRFDSDNKLRFASYNGGYNFQLITDAVYRDISAWYHIVIILATTESTSSNRAKLYVNGVQVTTWSTETYPSQNFESFINNTNIHYIGKYGNSSARQFDGYLADVHFIDGQALAPTDFGETDDNGVWQPKEFAGTYGTNGFHLDFADNSSNAALGTDTSGNSNTWTVNNLTAENVLSLPGVDFDGSGDRLSIPANAAFRFGSSDFTLEMYVKSLNNQKIAWHDNSSSQNAHTIDGTITMDDRWHHIACTKSGTTLRLYVDGALDVSGTVNATIDNDTDDDFFVGKGVDHTASTSRALLHCGETGGSTNKWFFYMIGNGGGDFKGQISNLRIIKGTALYTGSSYTIPTAPFTNVTNTVLLCCQSNTSTTANAVSPDTITATGDVFAADFNDSTSNNDSLVDTPTNGTQTDAGAGGEVVGNYATFNSVDNTAILSNGNLVASGSGSGQLTARGTIGVTSGKYYFEYTVNALGTTEDQLHLGFGSILGAPSGGFTVYLRQNGTANFTPSTGSLFSFTTNDIIGFAVDFTNSTFICTKNGGSAMTGSFTPVTSSHSFRLLTGSSGVIVVNAGQRAFAYTAPSGYKALCTSNLPEPTIADGSLYFDTKLWTGNGATRSITGYNFSTDFVWIKSRSSSSYWNVLFDTVRGNGNQLTSNGTDAELASASNVAGKVSAFTSDGFTLTAGSSGIASVNATSQSYVGWAWDAGSSTTTIAAGANGTNLPGTACQVRANPSAGFSIVKVDSPNGTEARVHGLNKKPDLIIAKALTGSQQWHIYHSALGKNYYGTFTTNAFSSSDQWGSNEPDSTYFYVKTNTGSGANYAGGMIYYCFSSVEGYSSVGSYIGNGSAEGPFVFTGFKPALVIIKGSSASGGNWMLYDNARGSFNLNSAKLAANMSGEENNSGLGGTSLGLDFLSNGFKNRNDGGANHNASSQTYIYIAFAENPFQANGGLAR